MRVEHWRAWRGPNHSGQKGQRTKAREKSHEKRAFAFSLSSLLRLLLRALCLRHFGAFITEAQGKPRRTETERRRRQQKEKEREIKSE